MVRKSGLKEWGYWYSSIVSKALDSVKFESFHVHSPAFNVQSPASSVQGSKSSVQSPAPSIQSLASRVQSPTLASRVWEFRYATFFEIFFQWKLFPCGNQSILITFLLSHSFGRIWRTQIKSIDKIHCKSYFLIIWVKIPEAYISRHLLLFWFFKINWKP